MLYGVKIGWEMDRAESQGRPEKFRKSKEIIDKHKHGC